MNTLRTDPSRFHTRLQEAVVFACGATLLWAVGVQYLMLLAVATVFLAYRLWSHPSITLQARHPARAALAYLAWILLTLLLQEVSYPETAPHAFHAVRLALTLMLFMSLPPALAAAGIRGAWFGLALVLAVTALQGMGWLPPIEYWSHVTDRHGTNKAIGASILVSILAVTIFAWTLGQSDTQSRLLGLMLFTVLLLFIVFGNGKRTAMVGLPVGVAMVMLYLLRHNKARLLVAFVAGAVLIGGLVALAPRIQAQWMEGIQEVRQALAGEVNPGSWNPRIHMIRITSGMIEEEPLTGWGVGAWNSQWQERAPEVIRNTNMPHNDFLWLGAETGLPGALAWTGLMLIGLIPLWRLRSWAGAAASGAIAIAFVSSLINNGTRDATIGLPMLMLVGLLYARAFSSGAPAGDSQDGSQAASPGVRP